jgi:hypothetical protein
MDIWAFFGSWLKVLLGLSLLACSGAVDGIGPGGEVGGPLGGIGQTNNAEGTLSSQSGYQELAGGCGNEWTLRFASETSETQNYILRESDPAFFPKVTVGKLDDGDFQACNFCQGRLLRAIDLGEAPGWTQGTLQQHGAKMVGWIIALSNDTWSPDLLPAARYRDYVVGGNGEADLSGLEMKENHLYYFIISKTVVVPVTSPTAFSGIEELNSMFSCPKHGSSTAPFEPLRLIHALEKKPVQLTPDSHIPLGEPEESDSGSDLNTNTIQLQNFPHQPVKYQ